MNGTLHPGCPAAGRRFAGGGSRSRLDLGPGSRDAAGTGASAGSAGVSRITPAMLERPAAAQWSGSRIPTDIVLHGRGPTRVRPALASAPQLPVAAGRGRERVRVESDRRRAGEPRLPQAVVVPTPPCTSSSKTESIRDRPRQPRRAVASAPLLCATRSSTSACRPLCESYVPPERLGAMERFYPLHARICGHCLLVQLRGLRRAGGDLHASTRTFPPTRIPGSPMRATTWRWRSSASGSTRDSLVLELASNDGYLLQHVVERGIPALGVEPARERRARRRGSWASRPSSRSSAGRSRDRLVAEGRQADLLIANNVLAHVPDLNDFAAGMQRLLGPEGVVTIEFPHLARLIDGQPVRHDLPRALLLLLVPHRPDGARAPTGSRCSTSRSSPTHGGSLRVYAQRRRTPASRRLARRGTRRA